VVSVSLPISVLSGLSCSPDIVSTPQADVSRCAIWVYVW
jgi:hypothetical protein